MWHAQVVLQHVELARTRADHVDARHVRVDAPGHVDAAHLRAVLRVRQHPIRGHRSAVQDPLVVVDVVEERVQRAHALKEAALEHAPFVRRDDPRDQVERDQALGPGVLAGHGEGDAETVERALRFLALLRHTSRRRAREPVRDGPVMGPHRPVGGGHFVVGAGWHRLGTFGVGTV